MPDALSPDELKAELENLTRLAGVNLSPEVFDVLLELTRMDVVPTATAQVLKSLCTKSPSIPRRTARPSYRTR
jgi:mitotic-spindle organizing protein 2A/2B